TADNGVRKENWTKINSKFNGTNQKNYTKPQLQSCYSALKIKYTTLKTLREQSGFGWDDDKQLPTAPDEVWN
ncbi:Myb/SANT-like domain-containing protein, partial [Globomyces pollinis-pini]